MFETDVEHRTITKNRKEKYYYKPEIYCRYETIIPPVHPVRLLLNSNEYIET